MRWIFAFPVSLDIAVCVCVYARVCANSFFSLTFSASFCIVLFSPGQGEGIGFFGGS